MPRMLPCLALLAFGLSALLAAPKDEPLPPSIAPTRMTLPEGFKTTLFAGEPDIVQPIAFTFDPRGRLVLDSAFDRTPSV